MYHTISQTIHNIRRNGLNHLFLSCIGSINGGWWLAKSFPDYKLLSENMLLSCKWLYQSSRIVNLVECYTEILSQVHFPCPHPKEKNRFSLHKTYLEIHFTFTLLIVLSIQYHRIIEYTKGIGNAITCHHKIRTFLLEILMNTLIMHAEPVSRKNKLL